MNDREREIFEYMKTAHHPQINSILVWEKGEIQAECYFNGFDRNHKNVIKSVVKSIMSIGTGIASDEGLLALDDPIGKYIPEFAENRDFMHRFIKIEHLLTMSSGIFWQGGVHYHCPMLDSMKRSKMWVDYIADVAVKDKPGSRHCYSEFDIILLAAVLNKATGDCFDYINDRLYKPLEIDSGRWYKSPDGVYYSVALDDELEKASNLTARDMLKIGQLFLYKGLWNHVRIVSEDYVNKAISPSLQDKGYGYLWLIGDNWYGCRGYGGQSVTVFPDSEKIVVTQATTTRRPLSYEDIIFGV